MLAAQSAAAARIARLPSTARESPQSNASGLKSTTRPATPIRTPMTRLGVSRSCRKILAAGATQSGVVYASTTVRPVDTSSRPTLASTTNPTMWSSVMLSTTGMSPRVGRTSRRRAIAMTNSATVAMAARSATIQRGDRLWRSCLFTGQVRPHAATTISSMTRPWRCLVTSLARRGNARRRRWKAEDVRWLVMGIVVAAQTLDHAQRVRRTLQELGQHQVIELEPGALRGLHAEIARLGVDVNAGPGQQGRRDHVGRGGAAHERGPARVPLGGSLVGIPDAQDGGLAEGPADDLHPERQAVAAETVGQLEHRLARDVPGGEEARLLPERDAAIVGEPRRPAHAGRDGPRGPLVWAAPLPHTPAMLARGLDVVVRGEEHRGQHARPEVGAEVLGPRDQVLLVDAEDLALGDDDLHVEVAGERPDVTVGELGAEPAQNVERRVHRLLDVVGGGDVLFPVMAEDADLEAAQILAERLAIRGDRPPDTARVLRVVPGQRLQRQRAVLDGPRQGAAVVERVGVRDDAGPAHQAERRHEPDDAAERRRPADRSAGIGAERQRDHARRHGRPRSR